jgi:hypothetical protein
MDEWMISLISAVVGAIISNWSSIIRKLSKFKYRKIRSVAHNLSLWIATGNIKPHGRVDSDLITHYLSQNDISSLNYCIETIAVVGWKRIKRKDVNIVKFLLANFVKVRNLYVHEHAMTVYNHVTCKRSEEVRLGNYAICDLKKVLSVGLEVIENSYENDTYIEDIRNDFRKYVEHRLGKKC